MKIMLLVVLSAMLLVTGESHARKCSRTSELTMDFPQCKALFNFIAEPIRAGRRDAGRSSGVYIVINTPDNFAAKIEMDDGSSIIYKCWRRDRKQVIDECR